MTSNKATEYERKRLENIKRNEELLASLDIKSKLSDLYASASLKRRRGRPRGKTKSRDVSSDKIVRSVAPIGSRRSLRTQGKAPDDVTDPPKELQNLKSQVIPENSPRELILISMRDASASAPIKRGRGRPRGKTKSRDVSSEKKVTPETPIGSCRSLRTQGKAPDEATGPPKELQNLKSHVIPENSPRELIPISTRDARTSSKLDEALVSKILSVCKEFGLKDGDCWKKFRVMASVDLNSMELAPKNVARVVPNSILSVKFFPSADMSIVAVGDRLGDLGFWNVDSEDKDGGGIYMYRPHQAPVSAIVIQPFSLNKIITSCYNGQIRLLDIEKEMFDLAYSSDGHGIISMSQRLDDVNSLYFGDGHGVLRSWDERSRNTSFSWELHKSRINTIDFNSENVNMMATSSRDRTVCIWDLRKVGKSKPNSLKMISYERAVQSAYFSPSGSHLATTSLDAKIGVLTGANYDDEFMINHNNQTGKWLSTFKGVWGWDDSHIFVGNTNSGVDIFSAKERRLVTTLDSPHTTAVPTCFDAHSLKPGMLAGATRGGQVYIWST